MTKVTEVDIVLSILDHQLVDGDGHNCGKVDDLELGELNSGAPLVAEILVGGNAWRARGFLGRIAARLSGDAVHLPWDEVDSVTSVVKLTRPASELRLNRGDVRWARWVGKIPGSR
jgi:sporulation protein YlmC with PRC-barrel domain